MQVPPEITFRDYEPSEQVHAEIAKQIGRLEKFSRRITSCQLTITGPHSRHQKGEPFKIELRLALPEHKDVIVSRSHGNAPEHEHVLVAIKDAFSVAQRQIEDAVRDMQGQVKSHVADEHGRVTKFVAGQDCGFIETDDGREIYFHRNSVLDEAFGHLKVGSEVRFVEEAGDKGAQASTVRAIGKHHVA